MKTTLRIARGDGSDFEEFAIEAEEGMTLLDALETIRGNRDPGLRYRHSCHHGSCGTCGARVDGCEVLMCLTPLGSLGPGPVVVESLRKMGAMGDIVVDPSPLFSAMPDGTSYRRRSEIAHRAMLPGDGPHLRLESCIECGLCVSACPVPVDRPFAGPAALAAADRDREERPEREASALAFAALPAGVAACDRRFACSRACPRGVAPGRRIENLRRSLAAQGSAPGAAQGAAGAAGAAQGAVQGTAVNGGETCS